MSYYHTELIAEIDRYLTNTGISEITFGRKALGDPHFVRQLRAGRDVRMSTLEKVRGFMETFRADADHAVTDTAESAEASTGQINGLSGGAA